MKYVIYLFILLVSLSFVKDNEECYLYILDQKTKKPIQSCRILSPHQEFYSIGNGKFKIPCNFNDSILIRASGYEDSLFVYSNSIDTIYLLENSFELEPITVIGQSKKVKYYQLGKKNNKTDGCFGFGDELMFKDLKFVSYFPNSSKVTRRIEEGYIYISEIDSLSNIVLNFYKNNNGKRGEIIAENVFVENSAKTKGWCKILFTDKIMLFEDGFFVDIKEIDPLKKTCIGMIKYKKESKINSFTCYDVGIKKQFTPWIFENKGAKLYFKVR